jgi:hypothetical protein
MTFKTLSKRQNGTVDPSLFSLHLVEGRVIPDWKKCISFGENIIRFLGDYFAKHIENKRSDFFTKSSAISPKVLNLFAFIDCNKGMSSLIRVVLEISKNGQCLYYRNVLFQLMYKICLTGFL